MLPNRRNSKAVPYHEAKTITASTNRPLVTAHPTALAPFGRSEIKDPASAIVMAAKAMPRNNISVKNGR